MRLSESPEYRRLHGTAHEWRELSGEDQLEFPALLPGLGIRVSNIFEGV
jgi:hypothetical protein